ncbi:hypothetical protein ACIGO9_30200 [Nocardia asteroides]|uniref:hypothetical protein n=1 Tax=Nocardia asteroides TaxID=1824 RepID=UPI0037C6A4B4
MATLFELTEETRTLLDGTVVTRIRATADRPAAYGSPEVSAGDLGGFVQHRANLTGSAWIFGQACVSGRARVSGYAYIDGEATVADHARVDGTAHIGGRARVDGHAHIDGHTRIGEQATVTGHAQILNHAEVEGRAVVTGNAKVSGAARVSGVSRISGDAKVFGKAVVTGKAEVRLRGQVHGSARLEDSALVSGRARVYGHARISGWSRVEDEARVRDNARVSGWSRVCGKAVLAYSASVVDASVLDNAYVGEAVVSRARVGGNTHVHRRHRLPIQITAGRFTGEAVLTSPHDLLVTGPIGPDAEHATFCRTRDGGHWLEIGQWSGRLHELADHIVESAQDWPHTPALTEHWLAEYAALEQVCAARSRLWQVWSPDAGLRAEHAVTEHSAVAAAALCSVDDNRAPRTGPEPGAPAVLDGPDRATGAGPALN